MDIRERTVVCDDNNIDDLRKQYPDGLHFVVGDTHGEVATLKALMEKIKFDPDKDHVYFVGDYNEGGQVRALLEYMAVYYQADFDRTGFHMIRGNHEIELSPNYLLENLPHVIVLKFKYLTYYIVHAGMVESAFNLINEDMAKSPEKTVFAYRLDSSCVQYDAPFRQLIWSRRGLYSQSSYCRIWPPTMELLRHKACIIHGHSPYCFFKKENYYSYGHNNLFWQNQHVFFSEELQSFNIDSNVKGRIVDGEGHRSLSCVCLEVIDEIAKENGRKLSVDAVKNSRNFVFSVDHIYSAYDPKRENIDSILKANPEAKFVTLDEKGRPYIC